MDSLPPLDPTMRNTSTNRSAHRRQRKGVHTIELIIALPVVFIATLAAFEFGLLIVFQQGVTAATIEGAREAAKGTITLTPAQNLVAVQTVVNTFLQPYGVNIQTGDSDSNIRLEIDTTTDDTLTPGGFSCFATGPLPLSADEVRVTVSLKLVPGTAPSAWGTNDGVPNWLSKYGFSLSTQRFEVSALAKKE